MSLDQLDGADAQSERPNGLTQPLSELERLRAENADLRAENGRLRSYRRDNQHVEGAELASVIIPLDGRAPGLARSVVVRCLAEHLVTPVLESAQLIVSEMVTNSVSHSGAPEGDDLVVRVHMWRGKCRLEVEDKGRDGMIEQQLPNRDSGAGLGLSLVQMLSERWGVLRAPGGPTRVWAQLPCGRELV